MTNLKAGMVIECMYKGEPRKARIEPKGVKAGYVKVFDLNKNDFRTFTFPNLTQVKIISR